jgi:hypothetical protein
LRDALDAVRRASGVDYVAVMRHETALFKSGQRPKQATFAASFPLSDGAVLSLEHHGEVELGPKAEVMLQLLADQLSASCRGLGLLR